MPIVLVVDDSEVDRHLIGRLLQKDIDWLIEYASNGAEALELMRTATPDVVVTDLLMPKMDGLQFVAAAREEFPKAPVVLVTGEGSEELASRALRKGAASYVPKSHLAEALLETVEQLLALTNADRNLQRLMKFSTNIRHKFTLDNDPSMFSSFIELVLQTLDLMRFCQTVERRHIAVAIEEALLNAVYHGNLELSAELLPGVRQELHAQNFSELIERRRAEAPYRDRKILIGFDVTAARAQIVIRDQGPGFDTKAYQTTDTAEGISNDSGRGLVLIRNFIDEVEFNETGNEIRLVCNRGAAVASSKKSEEAAQ